MSRSGHSPEAVAPFPYQGPAELQAPIEAALRRVVDPEISMSIVDVGLVYAVAVDQTSARVVMTMSSAACPVAELIVEDVEAELGWALAPDRGIEVELVWSPPWTPERMSSQAKAFMGW